MQTMKPMEDKIKHAENEQSRPPSVSKNGVMEEEEQRPLSSAASSSCLKCRSRSPASINGHNPVEDMNSSVRSDLTYLSHQVYRILLALHIPPCTCGTCGNRHQEQNKIILSTAQEINNGTHSESNGGTSDSNEDADASEAKVNSRDVALNSGATLLSMPQVADGQTPGCTDPWSSLISQHNLAMFSKNLTGASGVGNGFLSRNHLSYKPHRVRQLGSAGRKSKYCTASEKAAVAEYAAVHGASAAARKFNIPPAVAAYYHRKLMNRSLPKGRRPRESAEFYPSMTTEGSMELDTSDVNLEDSADHMGGKNGNQVGNGPFNDVGEAMGLQNSDVSDENSALVLQFSADSHMQNAVNAWLQKPASPSAYSLGSMGNGMSLGRMGSNSGGRGRGRPKLIGDELDAQLLVHLAEIRKGMTEKLTPDMVLALATEFIRKDNPRMLAEDGGTIVLKPTWAMKVISRMNDAERMNMFT